MVGWAATAAKAVVDLAAVAAGWAATGLAAAGWVVVDWAAAGRAAEVWAAAEG